jgi:hypothetical protein
MFGSDSVPIQRSVSQTQFRIPIPNLKFNSGITTMDHPSRPQYPSHAFVPSIHPLSHFPRGAPSPPISDFLRHLPNIRGRHPPSFPVPILVRFRPVGSYFDHRVGSPYHVHRFMSIGPLGRFTRSVHSVESLGRITLPNHSAESIVRITRMERIYVYNNSQPEGGDPNPLYSDGGSNHTQKSSRPPTGFHGLGRSIRIHVIVHSLPNRGTPTLPIQTGGSNHLQKLSRSSSGFHGLGRSAGRISIQGRITVGGWSDRFGWSVHGPVHSSDHCDWSVHCTGSVVPGPSMGRFRLGSAGNSEY